MRFDERALGGKLEMMLTHAESPEAAKSPPGNADRILHACLVIDALAKNGRVNMPLEKTFWVDAFGMLTDRFGTPWMVSGGKQSKP
ncbi:MAG: hypothetical protein ACRETI_09815 [Steroidobacteraceae bacterium]